MDKLHCYFYFRHTYKMQSRFSLIHDDEDDNNNIRQKL